MSQSQLFLGAGGLLKLRVNPSDESIARAVSTVAQLCDKSEFENLAEKMEAGQAIRFKIEDLAEGNCKKKTCLSI